MKRYESRYCSFEVPDDWIPAPPFGFTDSEHEEDCSSIQVFERWGDQPSDAIRCVEEDKNQLAYLERGFELIDSGHYSQLDISPQASQFLLYSFITGIGAEKIAKKIFWSKGIFLLEVLIVWPKSTKDLGVLTRVESTIRASDLSFLDHFNGFRLYPLGYGVSEDAPGEGRSAFPYCCLSLPNLDSWSVGSENGEAVYQRQGWEIRLRRLIGHTTDLGEWLGEKMKWIQDTHGLVFGSEQAETEEGHEYALIMFEEGAARRRWRSAASSCCLQVVVSQQEHIFLWILKGERQNIDLFLPDFRFLIDNTTFLEKSEWRTDLVESWVDGVLSGPWISPGPGTYLYTGREQTLVYVGVEGSETPFDEIARASLESMRGSLDLKPGYKEEERRGKFQGNEALWFSLRGYDRESDWPQALRILQFFVNDRIHSIIVRGIDSDNVDDVFYQISSFVNLGESPKYAHQPVG